jgi:hypothetical protein
VEVLILRLVALAQVVKEMVVVMVVLVERTPLGLATDGAAGEEDAVDIMAMVEVVVVIHKIVVMVLQGLVTLLVAAVWLAKQVVVMEAVVAAVLV